MSKLSNVNVIVKDGGLGLVSPDQTIQHAKVGTCSLGTANEIVYLTSPDQVAGSFGTGPLANALYDAFAAGARKIYAVKAATDVAATIGAITATKTGQGNITAAGTPLDAYEVVIELLQAGALNTATFRYSLDGGDTWSEEITTPSAGTYVLAGTGITLTFTEHTTPADSFDVGDAYGFKTTAPGASVNNITDAINAVLNSSVFAEYIHVVGSTNSSVWSALSTLMDTAATDKYKYTHVLCEAAGPTDGQEISAWVQALVTAADGFDSTRVAVCAAWAEIQDSLTGRVVNRNGAGIYSGRVSSIPEKRSPARVRDGALPNVVRINPLGLSEEQIKDLSDAGFITFREYEGIDGVYVTEGRMMAAAESDFQYVELRRVMDKACRKVRLAALQYKHAEAEGDMEHLKASLQAEIDTMVGAKDIVSGRIVIPDGQDILSTGKLIVKIRITPISIMREIELEVGFENPLLQAV